MTDEASLERRLDGVLARHESLAIAVSGGVDSMTLAAFAHRRRPSGIAIVPCRLARRAGDGDRTGAFAGRRGRGWRLIVTEAGEFNDPRYRNNPVDRCYFCKSNLYDRIRALTAQPIASGANLDDLGDYRPGLLAASEREVIHPYIEARMEKAAVRALARRLDLGAIAELPAQPCLASRIETGIFVEADDLSFIDRMERRLAQAAPAGATIRCRVTRRGIFIECADIDAATVPDLEAIAGGLCAEAGRDFAGIRDYRRGAMFVRSGT